jgi:hypothetical protein
VPVSVRVGGAQDLRALSRDLKVAGRKDLRKELFAGLNRSTKPLRAAAKANALDTLPETGGLNRRVAAATMTVRGGGARLTIVARPSKRGGQFDPLGVDGGIVRHPTYGHGPTVAQHVQPGWFTKPMLAGADEVRHELVLGIDVVAAKLEGGRAAYASARAKILARGDLGELTREEQDAFVNTDL